MQYKAFTRTHTYDISIFSGLALRQMKPLNAGTDMAALCEYISPDNRTCYHHGKLQSSALLSAIESLSAPLLSLMTTLFITTPLHGGKIVTLVVMEMKGCGKTAKRRWIHGQCTALLMNGNVSDTWTVWQPLIKCPHWQGIGQVWQHSEVVS